MPVPSRPLPVARLRRARVSFGGHDALVDIDLDVHGGRIAVIVGSNGAGKSTLLEALAGTRDLDAGSREAASSLAVVPQTAAVSSRLPVCVRDVVAVGAWGRRGAWRRLDAEARGAIGEAMRRMDVDDLAAASFAALSGGQRQRTLLAQGLARGADLLLLDEPTTGLDAASAERIREVMKAEAAKGVAVVCVSHDPAVIADADEVIRLADGRRVDPRPKE
ncbi:zinc ABC transporter ATP-binding protein AztA [Microbacterium sp. 179-I 3D4 NHS]|uniref:zinc ABC transporter ATP-binding protein AztA n=1 Tax=Microbacterium sp. 179-I 3D4 NHS TaxID=3142381 RepID=UPI00399F1311